MNFIKKLQEYKQSLINDELAENTIKKYINDVEQLYSFLESEDLDLNKQSLINYKEFLQSKYKTSTINTKITTVNKFLKYCDRDDLTLKLVKTQARFNNDEIITQTDYNRLLRIAERKGLDRDHLTLQVFYYTGIRVSELKYFTVEAVKLGHMEIENKGKIRNVPIPKKLQKEAKEYIKENKIDSGSIITNSKGKALSRFTIYDRLKYISGQARVKKSRVYPHSIRHLFAKNWLKNNNNNVIQLADILGHESLETTRRYTILTIDEMRETMEH